MLSDLRKDLSDHDIVLFSGSDQGLTEEAPGAYKDIETVIDVVSGAGISSKVVKLTPVGVIKG